MSREYLARKVAQALVTMLAIAVFNFLLFRLLPGDPVRALLPHNATATERESLRERLGLDLPVLPGLYKTPAGLTFRPDEIGSSVVDNQLVRFLENIATLELGTSFYERRPVTDVIAERVGPTLLLVFTAEALALIIGVLIGLRAGWKRGGPFDTIAINASLVLYAVPQFWLAMLALFLLGTANGIPIFPNQQMVTPGVVHASTVDAALDVAAHMVLPTVTLAVGLLATYALIMRSSIVDVFSEDYIGTARAKGLREIAILRRHALPNALLPVVTLGALSLGGAIGGVIAIEKVFNWPGMGQLIIRAATQRDFPVLQGVFIVISAMVIIANFVADLLYGILDPRVRR